MPLRIKHLFHVEHWFYRSLSSILSPKEGKTSLGPGCIAVVVLSEFFQRAFFMAAKIAPWAGGDTLCKIGKMSLIQNWSR